MESFEEDIRRHNIAKQIRIANQFFDFDISKGVTAREGEIREWQGKRVQKIGGRWVPISEDKAKPEKKSAPIRSKKQNKTVEKKDPPAKNGIGRQDRATLATIKKYYKNHAVQAYNLANSLSDEAKEAIPQKVWDEMSSASIESKTKTEKLDSGGVSVSGTNKDVLVVQRVDDSKDVDAVQKIDLGKKK